MMAARWQRTAEHRAASEMYCASSVDTNPLNSPSSCRAAACAGLPSCRMSGTTTASMRLDFTGSRSFLKEDVRVLCLDALRTSAICTSNCSTDGSSPSVVSFKAADKRSQSRAISATALDCSTRAKLWFAPRSVYARLTRSRNASSSSLVGVMRTGRPHLRQDLRTARLQP